MVVRVYSFSVVYTFVLPLQKLHTTVFQRMDNKCLTVSVTLTGLSETQTRSSNLSSTTLVRICKRDLGNGMLAQVNLAAPQKTQVTKMSHLSKHYIHATKRPTAVFPTFE